MRTAFKTWVMVLFLAGNCAAQAKIPAVSGTTLSGTRISLPTDLAGSPVVLIVGFSRGSREQATEWAKRLEADNRDGLNVRYYEMPELAAVPRILRGIIVKQIASEVPDIAKEHFLPIYDHEAEWRAVAGYHNAEDAYAMLVDGEGAVRWSCEGSVSDARDAEMRSKLASLKAP